MPARECPFRLFDAHEIHPDDDVDWTRSQSWDEELKRRDLRNRMIKKQLTEGTSVQYRSTGNSLWPKVKSGDCCILEPVLYPDNLKVNDIVFCEVQWGNRFYAHMILAIQWHKTAESASGEETWKRYFTIGNINGHVNGWCYDEHVYGRLVEVIIPKDQL